MNNYILIPANLNSKRIPRKPLLKTKENKYLIQYTWEQCIKSKLVNEVYIIGEDFELIDICKEFGASVIITDKCCSGSERCAEALKHLISPNYVINVQCEYPEVSSKILDYIFNYKEEYMDCIKTFCYFEQKYQNAIDPNKVKVVASIHGNCLYFSRSLIPYQKEDNFCGVYVHIGIYGFPAKKLFNFYNRLWNSQVFTVSAGYEAALAAIEKLEQLDWLWNELPICISNTKKIPAIDTIEDFESFQNRL